ncbi:MAG: nicotinate-nucleotide adenylyltransferase, partial [Chloroflexi bacterium]|nr:nicotinate-nucleotide adenylyltransferase [Chloroflexota bacterium]
MAVSCSDTHVADQSSRRIGIIGGTFDPVHLGHLLIAEEARCRLQLDQVIFVPARISPLKLEDGTLFDEEQRYRMVCAAIASNPGFTVSRIDLDRPAPSYTVDTLRLLRNQLGDQHSYYFVLGADSMVTMAKWRQPDAIAQLARLAVVSRPGYAPDMEQLEAAIPGVGGVIDLLDGLLLDISSTEIRRRLQHGLSIRYLVPDSVIEIISTSGPDRMGHRGSQAGNLPQ